MRTEAEKYEAMKNVFGIMNHEFSQKVIDACRDDVIARNERIENGETTFEEEDAALIAEWRRLNPK